MHEPLTREKCLPTSYGSYFEHSRSHLIGSCSSWEPYIKCVFEQAHQSALDFWNRRSNLDEGNFVPERLPSSWTLMTKTSKLEVWNQRSFLPLLPAETRVKLTELIGTNKHKMSCWAFELSIWDKPRVSCTFWVYLSTGKVIIWSSNIWGKIMDIADRNHWLLALPLGNRGSFP